MRLTDRRSTTGISSDQRKASLDDDDRGFAVAQNWLGGSSYHPLDADFTPPPADLVPSLIDDLLEYLNGATHAPLIQAALVHAQFETIHPFTDGNGRVGQARCMDRFLPQSRHNCLRSGGTDLR